MLNIIVYSKYTSIRSPGPPPPHFGFLEDDSVGSRDAVGRDWR